MSVVDPNTPTMRMWKCQTMYTMWHYVGFLRAYSIWIYKHNCMPMHSLIQHLEHSIHEHLKYECRLWMPLCNVANGYQRFREHMASIFRVEIRNSSGPFPSDCHLFIKLHSSGAIQFQLGDDATTYHSGTENLTAWHDSCLISLADYV